MEFAREVIEISSDEDKATNCRVPEQTGGHPGVKRKGSSGSLEGGASLDVSDADDDDDECVILDGVPENMAESVDYAELGGDMVEEMLIVGEKGQFACRDYPHPRYLCAIFLFSMTPPEKHCDMCHCYVCDCPAPCIYWASHCSSTHKEQAWRVERQYFRRRKREQHNSHQPFDAKLAFAISNRRPVFKAAQSRSPTDESRSTHHNDSVRRIQRTIPRDHPCTESAAPNRCVSKAAPSVSSLCDDESNSAHHHDHEQQIQRTIPREPPHPCTETAVPKRRPVSKSVPSLLSPSDKPKSPLHQDPVQHTQRTTPRELPRSCTETLATRPKDILCEIYKICPTVISCRRRIPPPCHSDKLSDTDQGD